MTGTAEFLRDVAQHKLTIVRDDGLHRQLWFGRPGTSCMHFQLITWPGYLCYTGDMGTYVFRRLEDMLQFFRRDRRDAGREPFRIDMRYWAEKCEASDKHDGIDEFSAAKFKADVKDYFEQTTDGDDDLTPESKATIWSAIEDEVLASIEDDGEHGAWVSLRAFSHAYVDAGGINRAFEFTDWERRSREYSTRFQWCCHALEWGIALYDQTKAQAAAGATA